MGWYIFCAEFSDSSPKFVFRCPLIVCRAQTITFSGGAQTITFSGRTFYKYMLTNPRFPSLLSKDARFGQNL